MNVLDCKVNVVYTITPDALLIEATQKMANERVNTLPVIDHDEHLVGMLLLDDVLAEFLPDFVDMVRSADFIHDFSFYTLKDYPKDLNTLHVRDMMRAPYHIQHNSDLMTAIVLMHKHQAAELPILDDHKHLIGLVSRTRVAALFLSDWLANQQQGTDEA